MKYIIFEGKGAMPDYGIAFPPFIEFVKMAQKMCDKPLRAGYLKFDASGKPYCYGDSFSLKLKPALGDEKFFIFN